MSWPIRLVAAAYAASFGVVAYQPSETGPVRVYDVLLAEDSRAADADGLQTIVRATRVSDGNLRRLGVRALGRLERPGLVDITAPLVNDPDPAVRREAVNALGQGVFDAAAPEPRIQTVASTLNRRLELEPDPAVRGVILRTLGRLPFGDEDSVGAVERTLAGYLDKSRTLAEREGAVRGLSRLFARRSGIECVLTSETTAALRAVVRSMFPTVGAAMESDSYARVRRLALATLGLAGLDEPTADAAAVDPDWQVRRLAVQHGAKVAAGAARTRKALNDTSPLVRFAAVRVLEAEGATACRELTAAAGDASPHGARRAILSMGKACDAGSAPSIELLRRLASPVRPERAGWRSSSALSSLAIICAAGSDGPPARQPVECADAKAIVRQHARAALWQVRMYAATSAADVGDLTTLRRLGRDRHPNVRESAIRLLAAMTPRNHDDLIIDALSSTDYQLVMTAARGLKGSTHPRAVAALTAAFDRLIARRSDTAREPLSAIRESLIAAGAQAKPLPPPSAPVPPFAQSELADLLPRDRRAVVTMRSGGRFELELLAGEAPATVARFVRLARRGAYDGLTFHRVEPDFVIQGGSPGANEYAGHDPYMRDEVGLVSHDRGTVGISTRGHDTGDAQFFINLVDNPRLDHRYTVFAHVVRGMDLVDRIVEGDAMARIVIR